MFDLSTSEIKSFSYIHITNLSLKFQIIYILFDIYIISIFKFINFHFSFNSTINFVTILRYFLFEIVFFWDTFPAGIVFQKFYRDRKFGTSRETEAPDYEWRRPRRKKFKGPLRLISLNIGLSSFWEGIPSLKRLIRARANDLTISKTMDP